MGPRTTIHDLPLEVLSRTFVFYSGVDYAFFFAEPEVPIVLGLVCKRWRAATLLTHTLWSCATVSAPWKLSERTAQNVAAINRWFSRSGDLPCLFQMRTDARIQYPILVNILPSIAHKVSCLVLTVSLNDLLRSIDVFNQGLPLLERLNLAIAPSCSALDVCRGIGRLSFTKCPNPSYLALTKDVVGFIGGSRLAQAVPRELGHLDAECLRPLMVLDLLMRCDEFEVPGVLNDELTRAGSPLQDDEITPFAHTLLEGLTVDYEGEGFDPLLRVSRSYESHTHVPAGYGGRFRRNRQCLSSAGIVEPYRYTLGC